MFSISKLKRAKNSYLPNGFFSRDRQKFQATPNFSKIYQNIPKKTKLKQNQYYNLYSIKQKINLKYIPKNTEIYCNKTTF
jgi:hypothetical protein